MNPKNLALVGAGNWGKNLARNFHALGALHTLCDPNQTLLNAYRDSYSDVVLEPSFEEVLKNNSITRIAIAAPAPLHYSLAKQALLAGKDVFVEKPLCLNVSEAEELEAIAKDFNKIIMVGHLLQYHPCVNHLQKMIRHGELGRIYSISSHRLNLGTIRTEENSLWSFAPHDISVILSIAGELPKRLRCEGGAYLSKGIADTTLTSMHFDNDIFAHIYVSWLHPFKEQKLVVTGSQGMLVFDDTLPWEQKLQFFKQPIKWKDGAIPQANKVAGEPVEVPFGEPLKNECLHFIECCDNRISPRTDAAEGIRVLKILSSAQKSLESQGETEKLDIAPDRFASFFAHATAEIHPTASIGKGTKIWHFSHVMQQADIGENCNIGQNVVISPGVKLGKNVKVQNNVSVYTGVICEEDVFLGPSMVFTNVINPRSSVNRKNDFKATRVGKGATIGANATIVCGNDLGEYCFVGAGAVVTKSVKPYALVIGNPAKQTGWMSAHGEKLDLPSSLPEGITREAVCPVSGERYILSQNRVTKI